MPPRLTRAIKRYLPLVVLLAVVGGTSAYLAAQARMSYRATAAFRLVPGDPTANLTNQSAAPAQTVSEGYASSEAAVISSQPVVEAIARRAGIAPGDVRPALSVAADVNALVITVAATRSDRDSAIALANAVLPSYEEYRTAARARQLRNSARTLARQERELERRAAELRRLLDATDSEARASRLSIRLQAALDRYDLVTARRGDLRARGATEIESATLVREATSATPSSTRRFALAGLLLGAILGLIIALVIEQFRPVLQDDDDLGELTGARTIAHVPAARPFAGRLPTIKRPASPLADGLRTLRVGLMRGGGKVALITSPGRRDGKTFIACNLAVVAAAGGLRTALVSADLRTRTADKVLGVTGAAEPTLAGLLDGDGSGGGQLKAFAPVAGLDVLPAGQPKINPADLLSRPQLEPILAALRKSYDLVIIDAPPVLPVSDPVLIADHVDSIVLVASIDKTKSADLTRAAATLRAQDFEAKVFTVANRASARPYR